jgi:hypothetical protein
MRSVEQMGCCCVIITERGCLHRRSVVSTAGHGVSCFSTCGGGGRGSDWVLPTCVVYDAGLFLPCRVCG